MNRSFYQFALSYRGGPKEDAKAVFAEKMFRDSAFPKDEQDFDVLSRYIEEQADAELSSVTFDEMYEQYKELCNPQ